VSDGQSCTKDEFMVEALPYLSSKKSSSDSFRSSDLRVMSPARFHCATLLVKYALRILVIISFHDFRFVHFTSQLSRTGSTGVTLVDSDRREDLTPQLGENRSAMFLVFGQNRFLLGHHNVD
jgi:hypothetical protein